MKLGIIRGWQEIDFAYAAAKNLSFLEFTVNHNINADDFVAQTDNIRKYAEKYGVAVGSMGRWGEQRILPDGTIRQEALESDLKLIDAAAKLSCPVYNVGVNYADEKTPEENIEIAVDYLNRLAARAKEAGVKLALYNCDWANFIHSPEVWDKVLPRVEGLGIKYAPSHTMGRHNDYMRELRDYGDKVYHFHVKGVIQIDGKIYDHPPAGLDQINWGAVLDMLYNKHYNGGLSIEPHSSYWRGLRGEWAIDYTIRHLTPMLMPYEA